MAWPRRTAARSSVLVPALALVLVACGGSSPTAAPSAPASTGSPPPATPPASTSAPASGPTGTSGDVLVPDTIALVSTNDLRVRSKPGTSGKVKKELLDAGVLVYVLEGPVEANGYRWYHVEPFGPGERARSLPSGWVAGGDRDGKAWLQPATVPCPSLPVDGPGLESIGPWTALACFGSQTLSFPARLFVPEGMCGGDPPLNRSPDWFDPCTEGDLQLIAASDPSAEQAGLSIALDPSVKLPEALLVPPESLAKAPLFDISGRYDHPAATTCASTDPKGVDATVKAEIVLGCRLQFVVTSATPSAG